MTRHTFPAWTPQLEEGSKILVVGASGGIGSAVVRMILEGSPATIGAHRARALKPVIADTPDTHTVIDLKRTLAKEEDCRALVEEFASQAGGLDRLVILSGSMGTKHFTELTGPEWEHDIQTNLNIPFYLARAAMESMKDGGSVLLTGTESALHGGSPTSFPYGVAKRGTECIVQGLAREGAPRNITVNGLRMGLILSGLHEREQGKSTEDMQRRAAMVPLKRGGQPEEAAALILYLMSGWGRFITGQMIPLTGGDWL